VSAVHTPLSGAPQWFATPPPPQDWPVGQVPQLAVSPPQVSPCWPQVPGKFAHVLGVHVGGAGTHEARSQIMYSMIRSCEVNAFASHSAGNVVPFDWVLLTTWKSL